MKQVGRKGFGNDDGLLAVFLVLEASYLGQGLAGGTLYALPYRNYLHACATYTSCSYYSRVAFTLLRASACAATIRGWRLCEDI